ncbi:type I restriction enzyme EcoAI R protein [Clostridium pasteurianum DSM 525 = ATCC 6013]|uniref:Type I restriction enzyme EcoAI R protein n=2 Tax=Clostridium pasteurianum TaxID=1501 RepID=A0A0H3JAX5_CLOPA|nr:DEAD/DEAH box helicase family protein [Clostridium pasteurianum]AJA48915.1 type I restriction enzyme EcoAI R protein [Clostridium pasteurianum DSM 525 = ATCC 6013]AJA52903.1 type I restriction enzyme EcoAI R protein [Clostridium pasteurianum DSM 525 = ATCC 6013]AOZ76124.1 restriction endonuclease subunit R [Clostridium pasteurianum DSM 525 = ATCC 6013]AOZ79920.1 restriction endonuclease subunit R [Clostridium pasteurianum]ELP60211.1 protein HsdR1 [Clostridium pasteurianum DSM 525 = ATCC 601
MSNFTFLNNKKWTILAKLGTQAENYLHTDNNASMLKMRMFGEQIIDYILATLKIEVPRFATQDDKIKLLRSTGINGAIPDLFDIVRRYGNKANHEGYENKKDALECLVSMYKVAAWFYIKVTKDTSIKPLTYKMPRPVTTKAPVYNIEDYAKEKEEISEEHTKKVSSVKEETKTAVVTEKDKIVEKEVEETLDLNEAETRKKLIDIMLKDAGWDVSNNELVKLEFHLENHKELGKKGFADYVLFNKKGKPVAVVEAKKSSVDPIIGRQQAVEYADTIERDYRVRPIVFYTNGYEIYMWDDKYSQPRQIWGFYTLDDLEELFFKHKYKKDLNKVEIDKNIAGRPYQIEGIKRVYERYSNGYRKALLVMATGTGKTRTVIALTKGMMEANCAKRVLFLADRDELVRQAKEDKNSFKTFMPEQISCRFTGKNSDNREATLYFSTYQTMINYYSKFSVGFFDLVICDESHRSIYKTYRDILEYFDAHIIGLTATPIDFIERNTFDLFNCDDEDPTFNFSVDEAWSHVPPYLIEPRVVDTTTDFLRKGIKYSQMTEQQRIQLEDEGYNGDEIEFDKDALEKKITNKETNRYILKTLMDNGIKVGDYLGKTIIFAKNKKHANLLESLFNEMYPQYKGKMTAVIYSGITEKERLIEDFKGEDFPRIAISVDLLDTGIDVPEIVNLVFAKPIYSKVKFWQMIGRGTRRCDNLFGDGVDKKEFAIFDCYKNFEFFEMNPKGFVPRPQKTSMQVRFELMCRLLEIYKSKNNTGICNDFIERLKSDIRELPSESIEIKKNRKKIEQVKKEEYWSQLSEDFIKKLKLEIAPLIQWIEAKENLDAILFDNSIYRILQCFETNDKDSLVREINTAMEKLARLKTNINQFDGKREFVKLLLEPAGWENLSYEKLEKIRIDLRDLMKHKGVGAGAFVVIDIKDTGAVVKEISAGSVLYGANMEPYEKRVKTAIEERLKDQLVIHKIRKGEKLSQEEMDSIYSIFGEDFVYTVDELSNKTDIDKEDIVGIIRRFIGVDEIELNKRFEDFIQKHHNKMNATQIKTLEIIKNDIAKNRGISFAALFTTPYTSFDPNGVDGIFGTMADDVFNLIAPFKVSVIS